jgi:hypothetical protein
MAAMTSVGRIGVEAILSPAWISQRPEETSLYDTSHNLPCDKLIKASLHCLTSIWSGAVARSSDGCSPDYNN